MDLNEIKSTVKNGKENFRFENQDLDFNIQDFWIWNQSNLLENRTRGILAEFIVKRALDLKEGTRIEWDFYDIITEQGTKIEIKSASYIQSWKQKKYSKIQFGIAETVSDPTNPFYDGKNRRWSDFYVFCLLNNKDQNTINPLDLNQWDFYVLRTKVLNDKLSKQKLIGLNSLLKLKPIKCQFFELKTIIK